jgi:ubiquinone/menaquinone biosynthesis C-methylase UbiE
MTNPASDKVFSGSIAEIYEKYLVPLIFEPYAADLANRVTSNSPTRVLEIAAGTGVATRQLASVLPASASIVATDLNQPMLDQAAKVGTKRPVQWRQADAMQLPFEDGAFDAVVCQFGVMFFPDKAKAFSEARRVLSPGGVFIFNVWDRIEDNEFADVVTTALASIFPQDPPRFMARTPHGYHDRSAIERDLRSGGFTASPRFDTIVQRSKAKSHRDPAIAYCQGTPLRSEIEARGASRLDEATDVAAKEIARRFGSGNVDGKIQAHVVTVER